MSLLNQELNEYRLKTQQKMKWVLCDYCRVPFYTCTKNTRCSRCETIDKNLLEYKSKMMIVFIVIFMVTNLVISYISFYIIQFFKNTIYYFLFLSIITLIIGSFYWRFIKKINK